MQVPFLFQPPLSPADPHLLHPTSISPTRPTITAMSVFFLIDANGQRRPDPVACVCIPLIIGAAFAFMVFMASNQWLGGEAATGMTENGKYFVGDRGSLHEVSAAAYWFSWYAQKVCWVAILIGALAGAVVVWVHYQRDRVTRGTGPDRQ
jgi:hypothetical protein